MFSSDDPQAAERLAAPLVGPLRMTSLRETEAAFRATLHAVVTGAVTLGHLHLASAADIELAATAARLLVLEPLTSGVAADSDEATFDVALGSAALVQPGGRVTLRCPADTALLIVGIEQPAILGHLGHLLGRAADRPLVFDPKLDLEHVRSGRWSLAVELLHAELATPDSLLRSGTGSDQLEEFLITSLLYGHPSTYSSQLCGAEAPRQGRAMTVAQQFIESNLPDRLPMATVAAAAGVSVRTLQAAFRTELRTTPVAYIRSRRLDRARAELTSAAKGGVTVTDVATRCGITHLGRFAAEYRARFGESPSQTLRRHPAGPR